MGFSSFFFHTYFGSYVVQSFIHSVITAIVIELAIRAWEIRNPRVKQRLLLFVIVLPILLFPVYQRMDPGRNSLHFRLGALFDSSRWLQMELWGVVPALVGVLLLFLITSLVFFFQEFVPIVRHSLAAGNGGQAGRPARDNPAVGRAMDRLPAGTADVHLLDDEDVLLFSSTGKKGSIYLSSGVLQVLSEDEVRAALAHEYAHVARGRRPLLVMFFLLRMLMFYNPVTLMAFRRIVQEDEKICDDVAVSLTDDPDALAEALRKLYLSGGERRKSGGKTVMEDMEALEEYSHRLNIESRITRLEKGHPRPGAGEWVVTALTLAVVVVVNYFVV